MELIPLFQINNGIFSKKMEEIINLLKGSNLKQVSKDTGIPYDRMYKWLKLKGSPKTADTKTLLEYFKNDGSSSINNGSNSPNGEKPAIKPNPRIEAEPLYLASDPGDYDNDGSKFEHRNDGIIRMRIKVVEGNKARGGYLPGFQDPEFFEDLRTISIDVEKEFKGHYLAFEIVGDSMLTTDENLFHMLALPGWLAIARELPHHHWKNKLHINKIKHWVIVHETDGILIKNIINHDVENALITIHSINPKYEDEVLKLSDIAQLFAVHHFMVKP